MTLLTSDALIPASPSLSYTEKKTTHHLFHEQKDYDFLVPTYTHMHMFFLIYSTTTTIHIHMEEHSTLSCAFLIVGGENTTSVIDIAIYVAGYASIADVYALSLLGTKATIDLKGDIMLLPSIHQSAGYLSEENIILGEKTTIKTLPMLDVRTHDVKASHAATIQRLDPQKVFYVTSRGISDSDAQRLLVQGYIQKALEHGGVGTHGTDIGTYLDTDTSMNETQYPIIQEVLTILHL